MPNQIDDRGFPRDLLLQVLREAKHASCSPEQLGELSAAAEMSPTDFRLFTSSERRIEHFATRLAERSRLPHTLALARAFARHWPGGTAPALQARLEALTAEDEATMSAASGRLDLSSYRSSLDLQYAHRYSLTGEQDFVGRQRPLEELDGWIRGERPEVRVWCLTALGGGGKSALAWRWIQRAPLRQYDVKGVFWCSFYEKGFNFPEFLASALAWARGVPREQTAALSQGQVQIQLLQVMTEEPLVFVLDGLERLMNGYAIVFDRAVEPDSVQAGKAVDQVTYDDRRLTDPRSGSFLRKLTNPGLKSRVLITSRLAPAELERPGTGQAIPGAHFRVLEGLTREEVEDLWYRILPETALPPAVETVFERCGYHPLVVSLLARAVRGAGGDWEHWSQEERHRNFRPRKGASETEARAHVVDLCIRDLDEDSMDVLSALATGGEPIGEDGLAEMLLQKSALSGSHRWTSQGQVRPSLERLVTLGFVGHAAGPDGTEYDVHPVIRGAVWNYLTSDTSDRRVGLAVSEFLATPDRPGAGLELQSAIVHFRVLAQIDIDRAWQLYYRKLWWPLTVANDRLTLLSLFKLMLRGATPLTLLPLKFRSEQANACYALGTLLMQAGHSAEADLLRRWCATLRLQIGDQEGFLYSRHLRVWQAIYGGRLFEAELELRRTRRLARRFGADDVLPIIDCWLGLVLAIRGRDRDADRYFRTARDLTDSQRWWAQTVAEGYVYMDAPDKALARLKDTRTAPTHESDERMQEAWEKLTGGLAQFQKHSYEEAQQLLSEAVDLALRGSSAIIQCFAHACMAEIAFESQDYEAARYDQTGVSCPPVAIAADPSLPDRSFSVVLNALDSTPRVGLECDHFYVDATPDRLQRLSIAASPCPSPDGCRMGAVARGGVNRLRYGDFPVSDAIDYLQNTVWHVLGRHAALFVHQRSLQPVWRLPGMNPLAPPFEALSGRIPMWRLTSCLRELVRDKVSIRYMAPVLERALDYLQYTSPESRYAMLGDPVSTEASDSESDLLTFLRSGLAMQAAEYVSGGSGTIVACSIDPSMQAVLADDGRWPDIELERAVVEAFERERRQLSVSIVPHVVTSAAAARRLREILRHRYPAAAALSFAELPPGLKVQPVSRIALGHSAPVPGRRS